MTRQVDRRELRRLSVALGLGGPFDHIGRLALIAAGAIAFLGALVAIAMPTGPATAHYGAVTALGFLETDDGSRPYAIARIGGRQVRVPLRRSGLCRVGDRIVVLRHQTLFGHSHRIALEGCTRPV